MLDLKHIIAQKQQIKDSFLENEDKSSHLEEDEEYKSSWSGVGSTNAEILDENVVNKNSFCILLGAYLRKHAVSPKNVNIKEYELLLNTYKALFKIMQRDFKGA